MNSYKFAINMELDGEKFYKEQAEINKDNSLKIVFLLLAKDEENHARILQNKLNELSFELPDNNTLSQSKNVFKGIIDLKKEIEIPCFNNFNISFLQFFSYYDICIYR